MITHGNHNYQLLILNYQLSRATEAFQQDVLATHHAIVDVTHPQLMGEDKCQADDQHDGIGDMIGQERLQKADEHQREEECHELHDYLIVVVLDAVLADKFRVQGNGLLVVDGHLEANEVLESSREQGIGEQHQHRPFAGEDRGEHEQHGQQE